MCACHVFLQVGVGNLVLFTGVFQGLRVILNGDRCELQSQKGKVKQFVPDLRNRAFEKVRLTAMQISDSVSQGLQAK